MRDLSSLNYCSTLTCVSVQEVLHKLYAFQALPVCDNIKFKQGEAYYNDDKEN